MSWSTAWVLVAFACFLFGVVVGTWLERQEHAPSKRDAPPGG